MLIERAVGHHLLQLRHQRGMLPGRQPGREPGLLDLYVQQIQAVRLLLHPGQAGEVRQGAAPPERQRILQPQRTAGRIS